MNIKRVHHIAIICGNYPVSKKFYTEILGFKVIKETYREERRSYKLDLAIDGIYQLELFSFPDIKERLSFPEAKGLRHLAFAVPDIAECIKELDAKGVKLEALRRDELTNKRFVFFYDPDGQPLELYEEDII